jgi:hypothetical protein
MENYMSEPLRILTQPSLDEVLLTPQDVAKRWSMHVQTLANLRSKGLGPRYYKLFNGAIRYPDWAVFAAEVAQLEKGTKAAHAA